MAMTFSEILNRFGGYNFRNGILVLIVNARE